MSLLIKYTYIMISDIFNEKALNIMKNIAEFDKIQEICDCIVNEINPLKIFLFISIYYHLYILLMP